MPSSRAEKEPSREEPGSTIPPADADEQDQDGPTTSHKKTFLQQAKDAMDEHETLGRLLAQGA